MIETYKAFYPGRSIEDIVKELLTSSGFKGSKFSVVPFQVTKSFSIGSYGNGTANPTGRNAFIYLVGDVSTESSGSNNFGAGNSVAKTEYFLGDLDVSYGWQDNLGSFNIGDDVAGYWQTLWMITQRTENSGDHIARRIGMNVNQSVCKEVGLNYAEPVFLRNKLFSGLRLNSGAKNPDPRSVNGVVAFIDLDFIGFKISVR